MTTSLHDPPAPASPRGRRLVRWAAWAILAVLALGVVVRFAAPSVHVQVTCNGQTEDKHIRPGGSFFKTCGGTTP